MSNNKGTEIKNNDTDALSELDYSWQGYEPITVENSQSDDHDRSQNNSRDLNLNASKWKGMQTGSINYPSQQPQNWYTNIPAIYRQTAHNWANQQGMLRITPIAQKQKYTYSTVAYIANKTEEPKVQTFPISDVNVVPHQITFDFYDTTEGRIGISNAVEKHMSVECDVYLTDLLAQYWIFGDDKNSNIGLSFFNNKKKEWWNAVESGNYLKFEGDLESRPEFADFRNTFLQQHSGWVCRFASHTFGVFQGVFTDVSYSIGSGETFAKWHLKFEEALFTNATSPDGKKQQSDSDTTTDNTKNTNSKNIEDSGGADDAEEVIQ